MKEHYPVINYENAVKIGELCIFLLTDGYAFLRYKDGRIGLANCSPTLHKKFRNLVLSLFGKTKYQTRSRLSRVSKRPCTETVYYSKGIVKFLLQFSPTYRKLRYDNGEYPPAKIPDFIFNLKLSDISKILRVAFDCEGSICKHGKKHPRIHLACYHPTLKQGYQKLLNKLGIRCTIEPNGIAINRALDIKKFAKFIGFSNGVIVSHGQFKGLSKNEALKLTLSEIAKSRCREWETWEINMLKKKYRIVSASKIAQELKRSTSSVIGKALRLGV